MISLPPAPNGRRNALLTGAAGTFAVSTVATLTQVEDPVTKVILGLMGMIVCWVLGLHTERKTR